MKVVGSDPADSDLLGGQQYDTLYADHVAAHEDHTFGEASLFEATAVPLNGSFPSFVVRTALDCPPLSDMVEEVSVKEAIGELP